MTIYIFTDGASKGNPGPGGWGAVVADEKNVKEIGGGEKETTNNRMELSAAIAALESLKGSDQEVCIFSDSSYLINGITKWVFGWQRRGWKTSTKENVANADLWQRLLVLVEGRRISWKYVPGHSDVAGNERANDIAEEFARGNEDELFVGPKETYTIELLADNQPLNRDGEVSDLKKLRDKKKQNKGKAYSYVSLVDGRIETHATWEECKKRVTGRSARFKKALSKGDEERIISEFKS